MAFQERGYIARVKRLSIDTTGEPVEFRFPETAELRAGLHSGRLRIVVDGTCRLYFTENDFTEDQNYIELTVALSPFSEPIQDRKIWLRSPAGTVAVELLVMGRG